MSTLEIHTIRSFPPSNLNRDQSGSPKSGMFGGSFRSRISSQCLKWQMRKNRLMQQLDLSLMGNVSPIQTKYGELSSIRSDADKIALEVARIVGAELKMNEEEIAAKVPELARFISTGTKGSKKAKGNKKAKADESETDETAEASKPEKTGGAMMLIDAAEFANLVEIGGKIMKGKNPTAGNKKSADDDEEDIDLARIFGPRSATIPLFGRMLAALPGNNVDAALSVAHAISTHQIINEPDEFVAVNDLNSVVDTGAGHLNISEFNSATYYFCTSLDMTTLMSHLKTMGRTAEDARIIADCVLRVVPFVTPTSKKTSTVPFTRPEAILVGVRSSGLPLSLCNAFEQPLVPSDDQSLSEQSVLKLFEHQHRLNKQFDHDGQVEWFALLPDCEAYKALSNNGVKVFHRQSEFEKAVSEAIARSQTGNAN